jgi:hypothetical protein
MQPKTSALPPEKKIALTSGLQLVPHTIHPDAHQPLTKGAWHLLGLGCLRCPAALGSNGN